MNTPTLKIGIQKSGRISEETLKLLKEIGLKIEKQSERQLFTKVSNFDAEILYLRSKDISKYCEEGVCDIGIVGDDIITEFGSSVDKTLPLNFGKCRLSIAAPKGSGIKQAQDLDGKKIATSFPNMLQSFLNTQGLSADIIEMSGSVELAPMLDAADAICDLVSSGTTLLSNGLEELFPVFESEVFFIQNQELSNEKKIQIEILLKRIESVLEGRNKLYIMMNVKANDLEKVKGILPSLSSPTVLPLADSQLSAVHSVIPKSEQWEIVESLKEAGAFGILITPVNNIF